MEADHGSLAGMEVIRMNCRECGHYWDEQKVMCEACRKMRAGSLWKWEIDNSNRMIRCPDCGGGLVFGYYQYTNPYKFCPYCGKQMIVQEQMEMDLGGE